MNKLGFVIFFLFLASGVFAQTTTGTISVAQSGSGIVKLESVFDTRSYTEASSQTVTWAETTRTVYVTSAGVIISSSTVTDRVPTYGSVNVITTHNSWYAQTPVDINGEISRIQFKADTGSAATSATITDLWGQDILAGQVKNKGAGVLVDTAPTTSSYPLSGRYTLTLDTGNVATTATGRLILFVKK